MIYYLSSGDKMKIYNRKTKEYEEEISYKTYLLKFIYNTYLGRIILKVAINPVISKIYGFYNDTFLSKYKIKKFIKDNKINMDDYEKKEYKNFNEFFIRKIKKERRKIDKDKNSFISPADSKLSVYKITKDLKLTIKNSTYALNELVNNEISLDEYKNGLCLVFRLSVDNYHRYCFVDDGSVKKNNSIKGKLHTVTSISKDYKIYKVNHREYTLLNTKNFDNVLYIEVGALMVGKIINKDIKNFKKGEEKGFFKLGGSTIVLLVKENTIKLDEDILKNSNKDIETIVQYGEKIAKKY